MKKFKFNNNKNNPSIDYFPVKDSRGIFSRIYCAKEFKNILKNEISQINFVKTKRKGTIRGFHYQQGKFAEDKILFVLQGSIYDVYVNIDKKSENFLKIYKKKISAKNNEILFIPRGHANAYQVLEDDTKIFYMSTNYYNPRKEAQFNPLSPYFKIKWPIKKIFLSIKDKKSKFFQF